MHLSSNALYVRKFIDDEDKKRVEKIFDNEQNQLRNNIKKVHFLNNCTRTQLIYLYIEIYINNMYYTYFFPYNLQVNWMDEVTRKSALRKIDAMKSIVAYPDELRNDSLIEQYYRDLEILPNQFYQNMMSINRFSLKKQVSELREPVIDGKDWKEDSKLALHMSALFLNTRNAAGNHKVFVIYSDCFYLSK